METHNKLFENNWDIMKPMSLKLRIKKTWNGGNYENDMKYLTCDVDYADKLKDKEKALKELKQTEQNILEIYLN